MSVRQYLGFQFLAEERDALLAALDEHPSIEHEESRDGYDVYRVTWLAADCVVEIGAESGTIHMIPGESEPPAEMVTALLTEAGAVFTTCC